jgi:glycosyltransferase involved in cell wall biosynthesis
MLERLELRMYRDATRIVCVTQSFIESLASRGISKAKLDFVPNGVVPAFWQAASRSDARRDMGLAESDILVSYVGTIGMAHGLSTVLGSAAELKSTAPEVKVLIVGDGAELDALKAAAAAQGLSNVRFTGLVPRETVPSILAATDIALVTLRPSDVFKTVLPSKMFEAMAARCAIVLGVDGEARATLERAGGGVAVKPGDVAALTTAVRDLSAHPDKRSAMGAAGAAFVDREFSRRAWAERYLKILFGIPPAGRIVEPVPTAALE